MNYRALAPIFLIAFLVAVLALPVGADIAPPPPPGPVDPRDPDVLPVPAPIGDIAPEPAPTVEKDEDEWLWPTVGGGVAVFLVAGILLLRRGRRTKE